jgi:hypothetical protein
LRVLRESLSFGGELFFLNSQGRLFVSCFVGVMILGVAAGYILQLAASRIKPVDALKVRY